MPTIIETLTQLGQDLRDAIASVEGLEGRVQQKFDANTANVTTIINNFNTRPLYVRLWVDPVNGNDANDGSTYAKAKKSLDMVFATIGSQGTSIMLAADAILTQRNNVATNIQMFGVQPANNSDGFIYFNRMIGFLGTATNSPGSIGTYSSGLIFNAGSLFTASINVALPDVPAGYNTRAHICSSSFVNVQMQAPTITVGSSAASALFGSFSGGRIIATINPVLGSGAAGHVFDGIAAGADPNAQWVYSTNLKSA